MALPNGFVYLKEVDPSILIIWLAGVDNDTD